MNKLVLMCPPDSIRSAHDVFSPKTVRSIEKTGIRSEIVYTFPNWFGSCRLRGKSILRKLVWDPLLRLRIAIKLKPGDGCLVLNAADSKDPNLKIERAIKATGAKYFLYLIDNHFSIKSVAEGYRKRAALADTLLVVTPHLAEEARRHGINESKIKVIEEPVNIDRLQAMGNLSVKPSIVWTGNPGNIRYLNEINQILEEVYQECDFRFTVISGQSKPNLPFKFPWEWQPYSFSRENEDLDGFWLGLAPIEKNEYSKCKDTYKIKTYFSKGIPVVATKFGYHLDLIEHGVDGYLCDSRDDWVNNIKLLLFDKKRVREMSQNAREKAEKKFSHDRCVSDWISKLEQINQ